MTQSDPRDGISDLFVEFDGLDAIRGSGDSIVRFRIVRLQDGEESNVAMLPFHVRAEDDGLKGQTTRAC